jgi:thiol-disulfide isomerase/thioredoxin
MKLDNVRFALAIAAALAAASMSAPAWAQAAGGDILSREAVLRDPAIPDLGNSQGDVTIVEYFDYQCPYCKKTAPELAQVAKEDGKVRIVLKDWPIFGPASAYAAKMALASKFQDKYEEAHDALIAAKTKLTEARSTISSPRPASTSRGPRQTAPRMRRTSTRCSPATMHRPAPSGFGARRGSSSGRSGFPPRSMRPGSTAP